MMKRFLICFLCCAASVCSMRAQVSVDASIDSMEIFIGEQTTLRIIVDLPKNAKTQLPSFKPLQHIVEGVEVLSQTKTDTVYVKGDASRMLLKRDYTLTSFDENLYAIPPLKVRVNGDVYETPQLALKVLTLDVDTLHPENFFPPYDVQDPPFSWAEWVWVIFLILLIALLSRLAFYVYARWKKAKTPSPVPQPEIKKTPRQEALQGLEELRKISLQGSENLKRYYTSLTEVLRSYIEKRFDVSAMEMTSEEIVATLRQTGNETLLDELRRVLRTADLVKFAKHVPENDENEQMLSKSIAYIEQTSMVEDGRFEEDFSRKIVLKQGKSKRHLPLLMLLIAICLTVLGLSVTVVYYIIDLLR